MTKAWFTYKIRGMVPLIIGTRPPHYKGPLNQIQNHWTPDKGTPKDPLFNNKGFKSKRFTARPPNKGIRAPYMLFEPRLIFIVLK